MSFYVVVLRYLLYAMIKLVNLQIIDVYRFTKILYMSSSYEVLMPLFMYNVCFHGFYCFNLHKIQSSFVFS
jgi:hypothetical protein